MNKIIANIVILFSAISAFEFTEDEKWARLKDMNCTHERLGSGDWGQIIEMNSVLNARPIGYRAKLQYTAIGIEETGIYLSSANNTNDFGYSPRYLILFGSRDSNKIILQRRSDSTHFVTLYKDIFPRVFDSEVPRPTDVTFSVTDDGIITLTVEGETLFNYQDSFSFPINYFRFDAENRDGDFYYNCTSEHSNQTLASKDAGIRDLTTQAPIRNWVHVIISIVFGVLTLISITFILHKFGFFKHGIHEEQVAL